MRARSHRPSPCSSSLLLSLLSLSSLLFFLQRPFLALSYRLPPRISALLRGLDATPENGQNGQNSPRLSN